MSGESDIFLSREKRDLIDSLKRQRIIKSEAVEKAFLVIRREDFVWNDTSKQEAYFDEPLPLGDTGQTISAPHMIAIMLEELHLSPGQKILEVGSGTGYNACLLAHIVSSGGMKRSQQLITTVERDQELAEAARRNIERAGYAETIRVVTGDGSLGFPPRAESGIYDRVIVTAGAPSVPPFLEKQLKNKGMMLIPVGNLPYQTLFRITKVNESRMRREKLVTCMFVPLVGENAYKF